MTLAIYIHWPYCARICPYCDFNVYKQRENVELITSIQSDLKEWRDWSGPRQVSSIHFGGGTPSLMTAEEIKSAIQSVSELWGLGDDVEIAIEANPHDADAAKWTTYQLTIEDGTAFARAEARGDIKAVNSDKSADFYDLVRARLMADGFEHYEVSNFARTGHHSQHNLAYWKGRDYVGVGPGAHGRLTVEGTRYATIAEMRPQDYQDKVAATGLGLAEKEPLSPTAWAEEYLLMGLRIEDGISLARFEEIAGEGFPVSIMRQLATDGLLHYQEDSLKATNKGRLLLNSVTEKLLLFK